jgi:hypothetical protein
MWVTREADAEYVAKKVRKMLAEINEPGSHQVSPATQQQPLVQLGDCYFCDTQLCRYWSTLGMLAIYSVGKPWSSAFVCCGAAVWWRWAAATSA